MAAYNLLHLPIDDVLPDVLGALASSSCLVLRAPTGAGKTTRVPGAVLDAALAGTKRVVMLEPRRVAARAAARRMAEERGGELGGEVGYQIRFERSMTDKTRLLVVTEGILVAMLQQDPFLDDVGAVVFDEFHERNLASDLSLAMARRVQREVRGDLKIVVMSATLEVGPLAAYLGSEDRPCGVVESEGRLHPVEVRYLERPDTRGVDLVTASAVRRVLGETEGDVLAFLPGVGEIRRTEELLRPVVESGVAVLPLYGDLPSEQQDAVLRPLGRRKVVLATNVAETSITIEGVRAVVDSGLRRTLRFDPATGLDRLELGRISRVSAEQRAGRAGRVGPGLCLRLWTEHDDKSLQSSEAPEVRRVDLAGPVLQLLAWGESDVAGFGWLEAPEPAVLERSLELLVDLGAVDARGGITDTGRKMARLPLHPRLARLLVAGHAAGTTRRAALLSALLSERDVVHRPAGGRPMVAAVSSPSDVLDRLEAVESLAATGYGESALGPVHEGRARHVLRMGRELAQAAERHLGRSKGGGDDEEALLQALLHAYPDRLARRREGAARRGVLVGGRGVRLAEESTVRDARLFLCLELDAGQGGDALVRRASAVERSWLPEKALRTDRLVELDPGRETVVARRRTFYRDLLLDEVETPPDPEEAAAALAAAAAEDLESALGLDRPELVSFRTRVAWLAGVLPELGLPRFGEAELLELLPVICAGRKSFAELRRAPLLELLHGTLDFRRREALELHAPERLEVPSGSRVRLAYSSHAPPVLAVRIQEVFGLAETPRVAAGRVPVLMHLLAPNQRPQQVTQDLASFWRNTYPEVRKDLRGRYPKHAWPEDPLSAEPERRPRRKKG